MHKAKYRKRRIAVAISAIGAAIGFLLLVLILPLVSG